MSALQLLVRAMRWVSVCGHAMNIRCTDADAPDAHWPAKSKVREQHLQNYRAEEIIGTYARWTCVMPARPLLLYIGYGGTAVIPTGNAKAIGHYKVLGTGRILATHVYTIPYLV